MFIITTLLLLCSYAAPTHLAVRPLSVGNRVPFDNDKALPPAGGSDITGKTNRRTQSGTGPYTGLTIQGPSGNVAMGDGGGNSPGAYVNQGSSGTIITSNRSIDVVVPVLLKFTGVPFGYRIPAATRDLIITYARQIIETNLDPTFRLIDFSYAGILPQNSGRNLGHNDNIIIRQGGAQNQNVQTVRNNQNDIYWAVNGQNGGQNQNGQTAWNNQNNGNGAHGSGAGTDWASNGSGNNVNWNSNGGQNNNGWQNSGQNDWQNNNWQGGAQNQNGQTAWNNQNGNGVNGAGADIYWAVNGENSNNIQNQNGQTAWNNQWNNQDDNGDAATDIYWAVNGQSSNNNGELNNNIGGQNNWQNGGQNGAQWSGQTTTISLPFLATINSPSHLTSSAISYVIQALLNNIQFITNYVKTLDMNAFTYVMIMVETYDVGNLVDSTNEPTRRPSLEPTPMPSRFLTDQPSALGQTLPMQFNLDNIAPGYVPSASDQESILAIILEMFEENLDPALELSGISYADNTIERRLSTARLLQEKNSLYLPVDIKLKGPPELMEDAYAQLLNIAENNMDEIMEKLKEMDPETFKDVDVTSEAFDIIDEESSTHTITHPVQFVFNNVEEGYELSKQDRTSFISSIKEILDSDFDADWALIQVAYASRFKLDVPTPQLPVRVTVKGPSEESDQTLSYIINALEDHRLELAEHLKPLDLNAFEDVSVSIGSVEKADVTVPTYVTQHPVQVVIQNVQPGYVLTTDIQESIVGFVKDLVTEHLHGSLELINLEYAGKVASAPGDNSLYLPLRVTVRGTAEDSARTVPYVIKIIQEYDLNLKDFLICLDEEVFANASISAEKFEFESIIELVETDHHVQLIFINASIGYRLSAADRASIIRFVKNLLDKNLDESLELIRVAYAGNTGAQSLPLRITVKGLAEESDFALAFVMDVLKNNKQDIRMLAKSLDWAEFKNVGIAIESFDPALLRDGSEPEIIEVEETEHPVQLIFKNLASGRSLSQYNRASILRFVKKLMEDNLVNSFQLIDLTGASNESDTVSVLEVAGAHRESNTVSLPVRVVVKGPTDKSEVAPGYVMQVLEDQKQEIELFLKSLDWDLFKTAVVSIETFHPALLTAMVETEHPLQLIFEDVPSGSRLSQNDRVSILRFVEELMEDHLVQPFQLVEVTDASRKPNTASLPFQVTVKGPSDESDFAPGYVMKVVEDHKEEILEMLKSSDRDTFWDASVRVEPYDGMEETTHPIRLNLGNVTAGYSLSQNDRASIVQFVEETLDDNLIKSFQLIEVADASYLRSRGLLSQSTEKTRRLDTVSLPLQVTVKGPVEESDSASDHVMEALEGIKLDVEGYLKILDWGTFKDVEMSIEEYDDNFINLNTSEMEETTHPIRLEFDNLPAGYSLSQDDRASIVQFAEYLLDENLIKSFQLIEVADASYLRSRGPLSQSTEKPRRLGTVSLPLQVTVKGPVEESESAPDYVMQALEGIKLDLVEYLKTLDRGAFKDVEVSIHPNGDGDVVVEEIVHPVRLNLENLPAGYSLSRKDRAHIVRFVKDLLMDHLNDAFELVEVTHAVNWSGRKLQLSRRLGTTSIPLRITVRGAANVSDFALSYVMDVLDKYKQDIERMLETLDWVVFDAVHVSVDTYDFNSPMEETSHPVRLNFENVPAGYNLDRDDRASIIGFMRELLGDDIHDSFQLMEVAGAANIKRRSLLSSLRRSRRRLGTVSLPLIFTVKGPADHSDFALAYILRAIRDNIKEIEEYLKSLDSDTFKNVEVSAEAYDDIDNLIGVMDEEDWNTSWVWSLVMVGLLIFICCCCMCRFGCMYRRKKNKAIHEDKNEEIDEFIHGTDIDNDTAVVPYQPAGESVVFQSQNALFLYPPSQIEDPRQGRTLQIQSSSSFQETENSSDYPDDYTFFSAITEVHNDIGRQNSQRGITQGTDPPSEHNSKIDLKAIRGSFLSLPPSTTKNPSHLSAAPSSHDTETDHSSITSALSIMQNHTNENPNGFEVYRDFEDQHHDVDEPSVHTRNEERSYATQPNAARSVTSVNEHSDALVLYGDDEDRTIDADEPSGRYYFDEHHLYSTASEYHDDQDYRGAHGWDDEASSYATQSQHPYVQSFDTNTSESVVSSLLSVGSKKKKGRNSRRESSRRHHDEQSSYKTPSRTRSHTVEDPMGIRGWDAETSSYATQLASSHTQSSVAEPHSLNSAGSSVGSRGYKSKKKPTKDRRSELKRVFSMPPKEAVNQTESESHYYGHSNTFYV